MPDKSPTEPLIQDEAVKEFEELLNRIEDSINLRLSSIGGYPPAGDLSFFLLLENRKQNDVIIELLQAILVEQKQQTIAVKTAASVATLKLKEQK